VTCCRPGREKNPAKLIAAAFTGTVVLAVAVAQPAPDPAGKTADTRPSLSAPNTAAKTRRATAIKFEVFERGAPSASMTIPLWLARGASRLLPRQAEGVDIDQIIKLVDNAPENGILLEINDHKAGDRVVISVVSD
jgi:hypothetical protein